MHMKLVGLLCYAVLLFACNKEDLVKVQAENVKLNAENTNLKAEPKVFQDAKKETLSAKKDARQRTLAYYRALSEVVALQVEGDEAVSKLCEFFTCDSMVTKADAKRIVRDQRGRGLKGWRVTMMQAPQSRVERLAEGKVGDVWKRSGIAFSKRVACPSSLPVLNPQIAQKRQRCPLSKRRPRPFV